MSLPTIRRRLEQIEEYGLPHKIESGNRIKFGTVIGILDGLVPECIVTKQDSPFDSTSYLDKEYSDLFTKVGGLKNGNLLVDDDGKIRLDWKFDVHAFYIPASNTTHYFLMPSRALIKKVQKLH
ncbi:MAG: hypothetical protein WC548_01280 [Candidatus Pacearchaeota archaeon]